MVDIEKREKNIKLTRGEPRHLCCPHTLPTDSPLLPSVAPPGPNYLYTHTYIYIHIYIHIYSPHRQPSPPTSSSSWAKLPIYTHIYTYTVQITFIFIDFRVCDLAFAFKTQNAFYFQTDFNLRFKRKRDVRLTCKRVWCILHRTLSIQWLCPLHRTLSLKGIWPAVSETLVLNETKPTKRSQITDQNLQKEANAKCAVSVHAKRVSNS